MPDELEIVGYDDLQVARWTSPALTAIRQLLIQRAEETPRVVLRIRLRHGERRTTNGERPDSLRSDLATSLVVRQSAAVPAGNLTPAEGQAG